MTAPGVKILIADDSSSDRAAARGFLSEAGFSVVEASDGQRAVAGGILAREGGDLGGPIIEASDPEAAQCR